jgi:CO/xanthine dehydrogenase Mo-binding subunit
MRRREFIQATGLTGLFLFFRGEAQAAPLLAPRPEEYPQDFNAYLRIGADSQVGCFVGKVEMGQGSMTALAMLVAEELDVPLDQVDMLMGDTDLCPWDRATGGSLSMWQFAPVLRGAAAEARAVLLEMAAERLKVKAADLQIKGGVVSVKGDPDRQITFGQMVQGRRVERHLRSVRPKPLSAYTLVGKPAPRKDAKVKVTGAAQYAGDLRLPGTLHACVVRPPAHGLVLKSLDTAAAERIPGVRALRDGTLAAVLHEQPDTARQALERVKAEWSGAVSELDTQSIYRHLMERSPELKVAARRGDLQAMEARAGAVVEGEYRNAYVSHATLEPHTSVAQWKDGRMTLWTSTQAPFQIRTTVAQALGLAEHQVRVITPFLGGGFGGKLVGPDALEAARLARLVPGRPVQLAWGRKEDFFLDTFRPAAVVKIRSGLNREGYVSFWDYQVFGINQNEAEFAYDFQATRFLATGASSGTPGLHPFQTGAWRGPGANTNTFARESHLDLTAAKAGIDPLAFRLRHLSDQRLIRLLDALAQRFGYTPAPAPSGRGVGLACGAWRGTLVATIAQVAVDRSTGQIRVERVVEAVDMGLVVNPDGARQQVEGAVTMGLGYSLAEEVRFQGGRILDENFDTYQIPRFSWLPKIEVVLMDNPDLPAQGLGEPPVVTVGAALANAVFDAVGVRMYQLPMTPERVLEAMKQTAKA